jgi:hypothetical protein
MPRRYRIMHSTRKISLENSVLGRRWREMGVKLSTRADSRELSRRSGEELGVYISKRRPGDRRFNHRDQFGRSRDAHRCSRSESRRKWVPVSIEPACRLAFPWLRPTTVSGRRAGFHSRQLTGGVYLRTALLCPGAGPRDAERGTEPAGNAEEEASRIPTQVCRRAHGALGFFFCHRKANY